MTDNFQEQQISTTKKHIYVVERLNELKDVTKVEYRQDLDNGDNDFDVLLTHSDWSMSIYFDQVANELVFDAVIGLNKWLAIGLANNLLDADVIQWVTAKESEKLVELSSVYDKIAVKGVLL